MADDPQSPDILAKARAFVASHKAALLPSEAKLLILDLATEISNLKNRVSALEGGIHV